MNLFLLLSIIKLNNFRDLLDTKEIKVLKVLKARQFKATRETEVTEVTGALVAPRWPFHLERTKEPLRVSKETWDRRETRVNLAEWVIKEIQDLLESQDLRVRLVIKERKEFVETQEIGWAITFSYDYYKVSQRTLEIAGPDLQTFDVLIKSFR